MLKYSKLKKTCYVAYKQKIHKKKTKARHNKLNNNNNKNLQRPNHQVRHTTTRYFWGSSTSNEPQKPQKTITFPPGAMAAVDAPSPNQVHFWAPGTVLTTHQSSGDAWFKLINSREAYFGIMPDAWQNIESCIWMPKAGDTIQRPASCFTVQRKGMDGYLAEKVNFNFEYHAPIDMHILEIHPDLGKLTAPSILEASIRRQDVVDIFTFQGKTDQEKVLVMPPWMYRVKILNAQQLFEPDWFDGIALTDSQTGSDKVLNELLPWPTAVPI